MSFDIALLYLALALLATGCAAGVLAGLLGVGGGIVIVPMLYLLFPMLGIDESVRMHLAVGTSLATLIPTSISSVRAHHRKGAVDASLLRWLTPAVFIGAVAGTLLGGRADGEFLRTLFAVVALAVAVRMALGREGRSLRAAPPHNVFARLAIGVVVGVFSVLMGIGGGTLCVPILSALNVPIRRAVGTASAIGMVIGVPGTIGFALAGWGNPLLPPFSIGYVNALGFLLIVPATLLTAPLGARIAHTIEPTWLRRAFALFLLLTAVRMLF